MYIIKIKLISVYRCHILSNFISLKREKNGKALAKIILLRNKHLKCVQKSEILYKNVEWTL